MFGSVDPTEFTEPDEHGWMAIVPSSLPRIWIPRALCFWRMVVLLHRHREVGAALDRGVVGDHHDLLPEHPADAADHARGGRGIVVHFLGGERRDFEERRTRVEQGGSEEHTS